MPSSRKLRNTKGADMSLKSDPEPMHSNPEEPLQSDAGVDGVSEGMCKAI